MKKILPILPILLLIFSCTKQVGVAGPTGAQGATGATGGGSVNDTGTITGQVSLYNEFSFPQSGFSGVTVTITSGSVQFTATTSASGTYQFSGMHTDTYNLTYQKTGYGTMKIYGLSHFAGGQQPTAVQSVDLIQIPVKTAVTSLSTAYITYPYIGVDITLDTSSQTYVQYPQNFLLFLGKTPQAGPSSYIQIISNNFFPDGSGGYNNFLDRNALSTQFQTGDTIYMTAYTYNRYLYPSAYAATPQDGGTSAYYIDPSTGLYVYPNLSTASNLLKVVF